MLLSAHIGQEAAKKKLLDMWRQNRLPHAILLHGKDGYGGLSLAIAFAQFLLCTDKKEDDACGQCTNCAKMQALKHLDLHLSYPSIKYKEQKDVLSSNYFEEFKNFIHQNPYAVLFDWIQTLDTNNKQGNISAAECRKLIEALNMKSYEGGLKIMIMWRMEYLGKEGNILLKLIEEPPKDTLLLFIAEELSLVLPTLLSRIQSINTLPIPAMQIVDYLCKEKSVEASQAQQIALLAEGDMHTALNLVSQNNDNLLVLTKTWFNMLITKNREQVSGIVDVFSKFGREQQKNFLQYVLYMIEAAMRYKYSKQCRLASEERQFIEKFASINISFDTYLVIIQKLNHTIYAISANANAQIQFQALSIKMMYAFQNKKVSSLVQ